MRELGIKQRAALITLMAEARELTNNELEALTGFRLNGEQRKVLNELGLVDSVREKVNQPYRHDLTDAGWAWCATEFTAGLPKNAGSAGGALYALLGGLARFFERSGLRPHEVFEAGELAIDGRVRAAYAKLALEPSAWVGLAALRTTLDGESRGEVDQALHRLNRAVDVNIIPESNQKVLTQQDRDAAVRIGGEDRHLIKIGAR
ncbi:hypothetical protein FXN61_41595 [Lentzea sp. PSKA42]|uniref:DUF4224 domain-containing protein n=1 Tax=Lentzea indica TaxID=2604800 RepID=A0ABX1FV11_9PSEU|nr:DUF4224 domain-containing protein [Lentzea indica]NKE62874.1 hypothetical protein [Lentzea indica]